MVRDGRLADIESIDDVAHADWLMLRGNQLKDGEAGVVAERFEDGYEAILLVLREPCRFNWDGAAAAWPGFRAHGWSIAHI